MFFCYIPSVGKPVELSHKNTIRALDYPNNLNYYLAMHFQGRKLMKGDLLRITSTNELIKVYSSNILGNGHTEIIYTSADKDDFEKQQVYLDVLMLLGLERVEPGI
jgi:hypothetical protein